MNKPYKVSYRLFWNKDLKEVDFQGISSHPLYIQLIHRRKTTTIKSSYFDILSDKRFQPQANKSAGRVKPKELVKWETQLVDHVIKELGADFSLEAFKKKYGFYGSDFVRELEEGFKAYMFLFFIAQNLPNLGKSIVNGSEGGKLYDLIADLRQGLRSKIYERLILGSVEANQPFMVVHEYLQTFRTTGPPYLNIYSWEKPLNSERFAKYLLERKYDVQETKKINDSIGYWITLLREKFEG